MVRRKMEVREKRGYRGEEEKKGDKREEKEEERGMLRRNIREQGKKEGKEEEDDAVFFSISFTRYQRFSEELE